MLQSAAIIRPVPCSALRNNAGLAAPKRSSLLKARGAVLDRPGLDLGGDSGVATVEPGFGSGSTEKNKSTGGGGYRVLLLSSKNHTKERVIQAICAVIPGADESHAENCFFTAESIGIALVTIAQKEHAEFFATQLFRMGCRAIYEPDSTVL